MVSIPRSVMQLFLPLLSAAVIASCLAVVCRGAFAPQKEDSTPGLVKKGKDEKIIRNNRRKDVKGEETVTYDDDDDDYYEEQDFEDDVQDPLDSLRGLEIQNQDSVTRIRQKSGEILVSCYGMWWPMGNGGGGGGSTTEYYYVDDYGDDYRKRKRRRARKQKKAAKMKRKKKA